MSINFKELMNARYMAMQLVPTSAAAHSLCIEIVRKIEFLEKRKRRRKRLDQAKFEDAVTQITSDLVGSYSEENPWSYYSLNKNEFTDKAIGYKTFIHIIHCLERLGLIVSVRGGNHKVPFAQSDKWTPGIATRFKITEQFIQCAVSHKINISDIGKHFIRKPSLSEIRVKASSKRFNQYKVSGRNIRMLNSPEKTEITSQLLRINSYLVNQNYHGTQFYGLRRIFNEGDHPDFNWNMGGRLYAIGEDTYQRLKKNERSKLMINQEPVVELDVNASYLRILHGLRNYQIPPSNDIYQVDGIDRSIVKAWVAATLGHTQFHRAWPRRTLEELDKANVVLPKGTTYPSLKPRILEHFPVLTKWPTCGIRWSHLMFHESEAMIEAIETLIEKDVPSLPVHDSLIVPRSRAELAKKKIEEVFQSRFNVRFVVTKSG